MKKIIILFYFFRVCLFESLTELKEEVSYLSEINDDDEISLISAGELLSGSLFRTVKKYYCTAEYEEESDFLLFGTKAWTFPAQDVTLSLSYPSENLAFGCSATGVCLSTKTFSKYSHILVSIAKRHVYDASEDFGYVITKLKVIVGYDGVSSRGYITKGGILQNHISMKFVFSNITSVTYQFVLYGVQKNLANYTDNYTSLFNLC